MRATHLSTETLSASLDGELPAVEQERVEAHLRQCDDCRRRAEALRVTIALVHDLDPLIAPEGLRDAVGAQLAEAARPAGAARPAHAGWRPRWRPSWRLASAAFAVLLIGLFTMNLLRSGAPPGLVMRTQQPEAVGIAPPAGDTSRSAAPKIAGPAAPPTGGPLMLRRVIRTGALLVEVDDFDASVRRLVTLAEGAGGFVASSAYAEGQGRPEGTFIVRVPANRFGGLLTSLEALGRVRERRISGQDVTEEFVDLEARVRNLERHEQRLLSFMDRATKVSDLLAIEQELARVRGEIEALTGHLRVLGNQVELATIEVSLRQKPEKVSGGFWDFGATADRIRAAFLNTIRQMMIALEGLAVAASALVPVLALGALAWFIIRRVRARAI